MLLPESIKGEKADWYIPNTPAPSFTVTKAQPSRYGVLVKALQQEGENESKAWLNHIASNRLAFAHLMTTNPEHRRPINDAMLRQLFLGGSFFAMLPVGPAILPAERRQRWEDEVKKASENGKSPSDEQLSKLAFDDLADNGFFRRDDSVRDCRGTTGPLAKDLVESARGGAKRNRARKVGATNVKGLGCDNSCSEHHLLPRCLYPRGGYAQMH